MVTVVMGHNIQSVMEHIDNSTVHLNKSFLLKIEYDIISDIDIMNEKGIKSAPMLEVNGEILNFGKALQWVNKYGV